MTLRIPLQAICTEPENYSQAGLEAIAAIAHLDTGHFSPAELNARIDRYDLLFVRLRTYVDAELIGRATRLMAIVSPTTGLNHIDLDAARTAGIEVFHLQGQVDFLRSVTSTAEHTWGLLLALVRHIPAALADVLRGYWRQDEHRGTELHGKSLGILGFGRLGRMVARYGEAFGMKVRTFEPRPTDLPAYVKRCGSLAGLLAATDVLSIHVPLNSETEALLGRTELASLPNGAVILNTSRGEIIDEDALLEALESGQLAGAAVDVIADEKTFESSPLIGYARTHSNLLITPHIAGATREAVEKTDLFVIDRLRNWLDDRP